MLACAAFFVPARSEPGAPLYRPPWDQPRLVDALPILDTGGPVLPDGMILTTSSDSWAPPNAPRAAACLRALLGDAAGVTVAVHADALALGRDQAAAAD